MIGPLFRLVALASLPLAPLCVGERCTGDAMFVLDGSGSMAEMGFNQIGTPRISEARKVLRKALPPVAAMRRLGLIVPVIGYKGRGEHSSWENRDHTDAVSVARCLADDTGGLYVSAETEAQLVAALRVTLGCNVLGTLAPIPRSKDDS